MPEPSYARCSCRACGTHLEFPAEAAGATIQCPNCQQSTVLAVEITPSPSADEPPPAPTALSFAEVEAAFARPVARTPVSILYQSGLVVVAVAMIVLPLLYLAMIAAAAWATWHWATHFTFLLGVGGGARVMLVKFVAYLAPLFAGVVLLFFMIKPLFARRARHAQPLALNPGAEPLLFAFVTRLCQTVGAPFPRRIDIDCQLNASASFRRGSLSFLGSDLVLTIGLPLVAGLDLRQFAGVLAHEFGHFTQGFGMRLTYVIRSVNAWFARVVFERDAWDLMLEEWAQAEDWRAAIIINLARLAVWFSRLLLKLLMLLGHGIGCFMLRQMEYDADSYQIKLAGSDALESAMRRFHVLGHLLQHTYQRMFASFERDRRLPESFPAFLLQHEAGLSPAVRARWEDTMGLEKSGLFDTHPSNGDRIRRARQAAAPGVFHLEVPASSLFSNFAAVSKQVTLLHYADDLGIPWHAAVLVAAAPDQAGERPSSATEAEAAQPVAASRYKLRERQ